VLRGHPYALREVEALESGDVRSFDYFLFKHIGHVFKNFFRTCVLSVTRARFVIPYKFGITSRYYQRLTWASATFAFLSDILLGRLGPQLKSKGKATGRMADALGWMFLATATLKRFESDGRKREDIPLLQWGLDHSFRQIEQALSDTVSNLDLPLLKPFLKLLLHLNPLGVQRRDSLDLEISALIQTPSEQRDRLTAGIYIPGSNEQLGMLEKAHVYAVESDLVANKIRKATKRGILQKNSRDVYRDAVGQNVISKDEYEAIKNAQHWQNQAIQVDDSSPDETTVA
jgi:acyl-CoA dehydrogenase